MGMELMSQPQSSCRVIGSFEAVSDWSIVWSGVVFSVPYG